MRCGVKSTTWAGLQARWGVKPVRNLSINNARPELPVYNGMKKQDPTEEEERVTRKHLHESPTKIKVKMKKMHRFPPYISVGDEGRAFYFFGFDCNGSQGVYRRRCSKNTVNISLHGEKFKVKKFCNEYDDYNEFRKIPVQECDRAYWESNDPLPEEIT